ncbi:MAG: Rieske 2Fe-2S domain-containing protein, partial [Rhodospirillales bacterium]|nr:Rieske 2Fe-2S domain-containing protein [Rhodospirillales bacterium]
MLTKETNDRLTRTDRGTMGGEMMRRYWQPVALSEELISGAAPLPVKIMGEEMVLFRDDEDRISLLDRHCCHRGSDISYGRMEDGELRYLYHGWLFDVDGKCVEQPAEPPGSTFKDKVRQRAYPCIERAGAIFAYMGPGDPPLLPDYQFPTAPDGHVHMNKLYQQCNYLQGNESNIDPTHTEYVHRPLVDMDVPNETSSESREDPQGSYTAHWHVPIDDYSHWRSNSNISTTGRWTAPITGASPISNWAMISASSAILPTATCKTGSLRKTITSRAWGIGSR